MKPRTLLLFLKAKERERSTGVYMCDALWVIAGALGTQLPRYHELVSKKPEKTDNKTPEEVVDSIIKVLQNDMERRRNK